MCYSMYIHMQFIMPLINKNENMFIVDKREDVMYNSYEGG